jgi:isocitrate dehydrogenase (NAD+)
MIFEAVHGTAPDIAGQGVANPGALILAACMMLSEMGSHELSQRIHKAFVETVRSRAVLTRDLGGRATTAEFTDAVIARLG